MSYLENNFLALGSSDGDGDAGVGQLRQELLSAGIHVGHFSGKVADDGATEHLGNGAKPEEEQDVGDLFSIFKVPRSGGYLYSITPNPENAEPDAENQSQNLTKPNLT